MESAMVYRSGMVKFAVIAIAGAIAFALSLVGITLGIARLLDWAERHAWDDAE